VDRPTSRRRVPGHRCKWTHRGRDGVYGELARRVASMGAGSGLSPASPWQNPCGTPIGSIIRDAWIT
jgi:hypothetical protein